MKEETMVIEAHLFRQLNTVFHSTAPLNSNSENNWEKKKKQWPVAFFYVKSSSCYLLLNGPGRFGKMRKPRCLSAGQTLINGPLGSNHTLLFVCVVRSWCIWIWISCLLKETKNCLLLSSRTAGFTGVGTQSHISVISRNKWLALSLKCFPAVQPEIV